jgi:hypothetical protein
MTPDPDANRIGLDGLDAIGGVREVHVWTNRPLGFWPQGIPRPAPLGARTSAPRPLLTPPRPEEIGEEKLNGEGGIIYVSIPARRRCPVSAGSFSPGRTSSSSRCPEP